MCLSRQAKQCCCFFVFFNSTVNIDGHDGDGRGRITKWGGGEIAEVECLHSLIPRRVVCLLITACRRGTPEGRGGGRGEKKDGERENGD